METPELDMKTPELGMETPELDMETPELDMETPELDMEILELDMESAAQTEKKNKKQIYQISFDANFSSFSLAESPLRDLQITAYKIMIMVVSQINYLLKPNSPLKNHEI